MLTAEKIMLDNRNLHSVIFCLQVGRGVVAHAALTPQIWWFRKICKVEPLYSLNFQKGVFHVFHMNINIEICIHRLFHCFVGKRRRRILVVHTGACVV